VLEALIGTRRTLHTTKSVAEELGKSERTIRRAIEAGELRATRRTGQWVMTVGDVEAWATSGRAIVLRSGAPRGRAAARRTSHSLSAALNEPR